MGWGGEEVLGWEKDEDERTGSGVFTALAVCLLDGEAASEGAGDGGVAAAYGADVAG